MTEIIVALDFDNIEDARDMARKLTNKWYKIGLELIYASTGDEMRQLISELKVNGHKIFLDTKLADIPTTVARASRQIYENWGPDLFTIHRNVGAAFEYVPPEVVAYVPRLTSDRPVDNTTLLPIIPSPVQNMVCPSHMGDHYKVCGYTTICPGIRLNFDWNDHQTIGIPKPFMDYIVVGRPITRSDTPIAALNAFREACVYK